MLSCETMRPAVVMRHPYHSKQQPPIPAWAFKSGFEWWVPTPPVGGPHLHSLFRGWEQHQDKPGDHPLLPYGLCLRPPGPAGLHIQRLHLSLTDLPQPRWVPRGRVTAAEQGPEGILKGTQYWGKRTEGMLELEHLRWASEQVRASADLWGGSRNWVVPPGESLGKSFAFINSV